MYEEKIPEDWNDSFIINCYKGKGDATCWGNYRDIKLLQYIMKVLERVLENLIRYQVDINNMQFGLMLGLSTTDAIYILRQMQEKHLIRKKLFLTGKTPLTELCTLVGNQKVGNWRMDYKISESYVWWSKLKSEGKQLFQ